mmetsp:Transcript_37050/g.75001  ORF Transcript_37050/g.75001 Transcript_37050/m.75001 type:complete len:234 (+) Transcript_37050:96-797(+)
MRRPEQSHCQLERELAVLSNQTIRDPCTLVSVRQRVRVIKNRLSAKRSREQARDYVEQLERNVANLATESTQLARRLARVEEENRKLRTASGLTADADVDSEATAPVDKEEKELNVREPAVLLQPSLQLDALLLFLNTLASHVSSSPLPAFASSTLAPAARAATLALALRWHVRRASFHRWLRQQPPNRLCAHTPGPGRMSSRSVQRTRRLRRAGRWDHAQPTTHREGRTDGG